MTANCHVAVFDESYQLYIGSYVAGYITSYIAIAVYMHEYVF